MKYRFAPLHLIALYFLGLAIYRFYEDSKLDFELGLGGLEPYVFIAFALVILILDLIVQVSVWLTNTVIQ